MQCDNNLLQLRHKERITQVFKRPQEDQIARRGAAKVLIITAAAPIRSTYSSSVYMGLAWKHRKIPRCQIQNRLQLTQEDTSVYSARKDVNWTSLKSQRAIDIDKGPKRSWHSMSNSFSQVSWQACFLTHCLMHSLGRSKSLDFRIRQRSLMCNAGKHAYISSSVFQVRC